MILLKDAYGPSAGVNPGLARLEDCESPFTRWETEKMITEKYLVRYFRST